MFFASIEQLGNAAHVHPGGFVQWCTLAVCAVQHPLRLLRPNRTLRSLQNISLCVQLVRVEDFGLLRRSLLRHPCPLLQG